MSARFAGNAELCTLDTAFLVDHTLIPVSADEYIYVRAAASGTSPLLGSAAAQMHRAVADRAATAREAESIKRRALPPAPRRAYEQVLA